MRSKNNLKGFKHTAKSRKERDRYAKLIRPDLKGSPTLNEFDIEELSESTDPQSQSAGNTEQIRPASEPYISQSNQLKEFLPSLTNVLLTLSGGAVLAMVGWAFLTIISHGTSIATQDSRIKNIEDTTESLEGKYNILHEDSINFKRDIEELNKDVEQLSNDNK